MTLNVLMLSTLFPDISRPNFGVFVERQARELASRPEANVTVIAPVGLPFHEHAEIGTADVGKEGR